MSETMVNESTRGALPQLKYYENMGILWVAFLNINYK